MSVVSLIAANSRLIDFIQVKHNVLSDQICDELITEYQDDEWLQSTTFDRAEKFRVSKQLDISHADLINKNNRRAELDTVIFEAIHPYIVDYASQFKTFLSLKRDTGYSILKYEKNEFYREHTDDPSETIYDPQGSLVASSLDKRKITISIALNDNFKGGGLSFFGNTYKPEVKKGEALFFPSWHMFPHQALPVTEGIRYSLITWVV